MNKKDFKKGTKFRKALDIHSVLEWTCPYKDCECGNSNDYDSCGEIEECYGCGRALKLR